MSTPAASAQYHHDGFYINAEPIVPQDVIEAAVCGMDEVRRGVYDTGVSPPASAWTPGDDDKLLCKIECAHVANHAIRELVTYPAIGEFAAQITGASMIQVFGMQMLHKPPVQPQSNTVVGWHQDRRYWDFWRKGNELFTVWVALSDVTGESGPMKFVRGSHQWGFFNEPGFFEQDNESIKNRLPLTDDHKWEEVNVILPPGGISLHQDLTLHASEVNRTAVPRRCVAIHMHTENVPAVPDPYHADAASSGSTTYNPVIYPS